MFITLIFAYNFRRVNKNLQFFQSHMLKRLSSTLLNYLSIIKPIPVFPDFCSFRINLEIGRNKLFKFLLLWEDCFVYSRPFHLNVYFIFIYLFFFRFSLFFKKGEGRERNIYAWEVYQLVSLAGNPGMCPAQESNQWPLGLQAGAWSPEPHQPGLNVYVRISMSNFTKSLMIFCGDCIWSKWTT